MELNLKDYLKMIKLKVKEFYLFSRIMEKIFHNLREFGIKLKVLVFRLILYKDENKFDIINGQNI
jgi:hypothetical protein